MKRIAFGIVTVTALAWGVSVQAAPNGAAASLRARSDKHLLYSSSIGTIATAAACATGAAGIGTATGYAGGGMASQQRSTHRRDG